MAYNFTNKYDMDLFIGDNIVELNNSMKSFTYKNYVKYFIQEEHKTETEAKEISHDIPTSTGIELRLNQKYQEQIEDDERREEIDEVLAEITETRTSYIDRVFKTKAASLGLYFKDLQTYYKNRAYSKIKDLWLNTGSDYSADILDRIFAFNEYSTDLLSEAEIALIRSELQTNFGEFYELALDGGYQKKKVDVSSGTRRANEGDAAQFLFLARAILSGFNCSNVDVRASSYDAVIDFDTFLLRVQVKGINHDTISFKTATRGGAGASTDAPTNEAKPITHKDCDIYVAVEKSSGICYIIPIDDIEDYARRDIFTLPNQDKIHYKEKWENIERKARSRFGL